MAKTKLATLELRTRQAWRRWLAKNYDSVSVVWLVFPKKHTGEACMSYEDAIEEALCFGWVDSIVKRLDDDLFARKFTPRTLESKWSTLNRKRYADLKARGLLAAPGLARPPTEKSGDAPRPSITAIPAYIEQELKANARAGKEFERLAPSRKRIYIAYIDFAKRPETKERRLREVIALLAAGKPLGLK